MVLTVTIYGACRLTDRPDLAPARDRGQRAEGGLSCGFQLSWWWLLRLLSFFVLGYITKSTVMICPSVKICDFLGFFFYYWRVHRVGEAKKRKKDTAWTLESGESSLYPCPTRVGHRYITKNGVLVQPSLEHQCWYSVCHLNMGCISYSFCIVLPR